jgi:hypothetical protein
MVVWTSGSSELLVPLRHRGKTAVEELSSFKTGIGGKALKVQMWTACYTN